MGFTPVTSMQRLSLSDPIGIDQLKRRNALAERDQVVQEQNAAGYQNQLGMTEQNMRRNWLAQDREAEQADQQAQAQQHAAAAKDAFTTAQYLAQAKSPDEFRSLAQRLAQNPIVAQHLQEQGATWEQITPDDVQELLSELGAEAGVAPQAPPVQYERQDGPRGSILQRDPRTGELKQIVAPDNSQPAAPKAAGSYRTLTPAEVQAAGLPPGTSAQVGPDGKIDILSKRDNTAVLSQKDATTAKMKLNTVSLARQQLNKIREAFEEGKKGVGPNAFGGAQGWLPTQAGKKFDARVNQMRSTLTALTRVPGVGAMSDYETKLDQSKFPTRTAYESVTADTLNNLDDQLSLIENGYKSLLTGGEAQQVAPAQAAPAANAPSVSNW